uniref:Secondary thiamine-phosphate synthase enzyme n=1 Tax=Peronospora matthiolae TaxID=2874970 RepID=A0AAV1TNP2_9STRA
MANCWFQKEIVLKAPSRGFHCASRTLAKDFVLLSTDFFSVDSTCKVVTREVEKQLPELAQVKVGMANLFIKHTSASLSINENCDPDVRTDMEVAFNRIVPESWNKEFFRHTDEGDDDMPGHIKSTLIGASVNIPITNGKLNLGTWQGMCFEYCLPTEWEHRETKYCPSGIYLCEHRNVGGWGSGHQRKVVVTIQGFSA